MKNLIAKEMGNLFSEIIGNIFPPRKKRVTPLIPKKNEKNDSTKFGWEIENQLLTDENKKNKEVIKVKDKKIEMDKEKIQSLEKRIKDLEKELEEEKLKTLFKKNHYSNY